MSTQTISKSNTWKGGNSPFNVSYGKLMMWIFLLSDAFTFSSLLIGYGAIRYSFPSTPIEQIEELELSFAENVQEKFANGADAHHGEFFIPALRDAGVFSESQWFHHSIFFHCHQPSHHVHHMNRDLRQHQS